MRDLDSDLDTAINRSLERIEKELEPVERDYRLRVRRFLTGGNAGGLIASLSLAGTMIGASNGDDPAIPLDWSLFCVIMTFLVGLASTGLALFAERGWYFSMRNSVIEETVESFLLSEGIDPKISADIVPKKSHRLSILESLYTFGVTFAWVGLSTGIILGITVLSELTDSPWW